MILQYPYLTAPVFFILFIVLVIIAPAAAGILAVLYIKSAIEEYVYDNRDMQSDRDESMPDWEHAEMILYPEYSQKIIIRKRHEFDLNYMGKPRHITTHYITSPSPSDISTAPECVFLCLHGAASSGNIYIHLVKYIPPNCTFYFIDLLGHGKSTCEPVQDLNPDAYMNLQLECLGRFVTDIVNNHELYQPPPKIHLMGHSFGAFIGIKYAHLLASAPDCAQPNSIQIASLTLISPAGLFPTLGVYAGYFGLYFKLHFPYALFRGLTPIGKRMYDKILRQFVSAEQAEYWMHFYSSETVFADKFVSNYGEVSYHKGCFTEPCYLQLLALTCPVHFVYGATDNITPAHQGKIIKTISPVNTTLKIFKGQWHNPIESSAEYIINTCIKPISYDPNSIYHIKAEFVKYLSENFNIMQYKSTYNVRETMNTIEKMYGYLIELYVHFTKQYELAYPQQIELADLSTNNNLQGDDSSSDFDVVDIESIYDSSPTSQSTEIPESDKTTPIKSPTYSITDPRLRMPYHIQL
jgi:pimeloyl-ACP methyl ester carboxylesterase